MTIASDHLNASHIKPLHLDNTRNRADQASNFSGAHSTRNSTNGLPINTKDIMSDDEDDFQPPIPRKGGRRQAVAAESFDPSKDEGNNAIVVSYPKSLEQLACLEEAAKEIIFFKKCAREQRKILFDAMFEKKVENGDVIIRQGDDGDNFYVIEKGIYDVLVMQNDGTDLNVATLNGKGFFGELALLYNCPRNATIIAKGKGVLWGLDQKTFRQIIVAATAIKRQNFEDLLKGVTILHSLTSEELMNLTDALDEVSFSQDEVIIQQGDVAESMYFVVQGKVSVRVNDNNSNIETEIIQLERGKYFGELALLLNKPRVASVYSCEDDTKCAVLDIKAFERLLGPCVDIMKRNVTQYEEERRKLGIGSIS